MSTISRSDVVRAIEAGGVVAAIRLNDASQLREAANALAESRAFLQSRRD